MIYNLRDRRSPRYNGMAKLWLRRVGDWREVPVMTVQTPVDAIVAGVGYARVVLQSPLWRSIPSDYPAGWALTLDGEVVAWPLARVGDEASSWFRESVATHCADVHPCRLPSAHRRLAAIETAILEILPRIIEVPREQTQ